MLIDEAAARPTRIWSKAPTEPRFFDPISNASARSVWATTRLATTPAAHANTCETTLGQSVARAKRTKFVNVKTTVPKATSDVRSGICSLLGTSHQRSENKSQRG